MNTEVEIPSRCTPAANTSPFRPTGTRTKSKVHCQKDGPFRTAARPRARLWAIWEEMQDSRDLGFILDTRHWEQVPNEHFTSALLTPLPHIQEVWAKKGRREPSETQAVFLLFPGSKRRTLRQITVVSKPQFCLTNQEREAGFHVVQTLQDSVSLLIHRTPRKGRWQ